jgi:ribosomal-protein-alanine N-acetyltransferase
MVANFEIDLNNGFREMTAEDVSAVMDIELSVYSYPWTEGIFKDCIRVGYNCWVYVLDDELIAYGLVSVAAGEAHILNLCVSPEVQGQGMGKQMLHKLMEQAEIRGADSIFLEVRESNVVAQNLYEQEGFNRIGLRKAYYPSDEGREDALVFAKALNIDSAFHIDS